MARFKKFSGGRKITDFEPLEFDLNGEHFTCHRAIQGSVILDFAQYADAEGGRGATALYEFLKNSMSDEEYERLDKVLHDPEIIIDIEFIGEIVSWLVEEYTERPTLPLGDSSDGQLTSGTSSTDEPSSQAAS